jgi:hypothetical protein
VVQHRRLAGLFDAAYRLEAVVHGPRGAYVAASSGMVRPGQEHAAREAIERELRRDGWQSAGRDGAGRRRFQRPARR